jgi:SCP-2 sterol transfer family protein
VIVPAAPERFFVEFLPAFVAELGAASPAASPAVSPAAVASGSPGRPSEEGARRGRRAPANAGIVARVVGAGQWTLRFTERALGVTPGVADDVALQLSLRAEDFVPLVVEPLRVALDAPGESSALAAKGFWTRLGRFDAETVDLLRRQEGRILVRVDDEGTSRNVALTPGLQQFSLEQAECNVDCTLAALQDVQARRKNPLDLFYEGQIRITGDAQIALAMAGLFL